MLLLLLSLFRVVCGLVGSTFPSLFFIIVQRSLIKCRQKHHPFRLTKFLT